MYNNYLLNQNNSQVCLGDCANCPFVAKSMYNSFNSMRTPNYNGMRYSSYENHIESAVTDFFKHMPRTIFWHDNNGICHIQYESLQDCLLEYCRKNYPWETPIYMEVNSGRIVLVSDNSSYEKCIRDIFKKAIDIAAEVTKDRSPQVSILFDEIGFVLADDIVEVVKKVISILQKAREIGGKCNNYL